MLINAASAGQIVRLSASRTFQLELEENPTTGYRWAILPETSPAVEITQDSFLRADQSGNQAGAGGQRQLSGRVLDVGLHRLALSKCRVWDTSQSIAVFLVDLDVRE